MAGIPGVPGRFSPKLTINGGIIASDAGGLLLGHVDRGLGPIRRMAACFTDRRDPRLLEHRVETLVGRRVLGLAPCS